MLAVGLDHDVDDVVEAGLPLRLGGHVSALLQSSWESSCAPSWAVQRLWCITWCKAKELFCVIDWLYSESLDRIWGNRPWCTRRTRWEEGRRKCRKWRKEFSRTSSIGGLTFQCGSFISEMDAEIKFHSERQICWNLNWNCAVYALFKIKIVNIIINNHCHSIWENTFRMLFRCQPIRRLVF